VKEQRGKSKAAGNVFKMKEVPARTTGAN